MKLAARIKFMLCKRLFLALNYAHDLALYGYEPILDKFIAQNQGVEHCWFDGM